MEELRGEINSAIDLSPENLPYEDQQKETTMEGKYTPDPEASNVVEEAPSNGMLQSGEKIKPDVTDEWVMALAERLYGISSMEMKEMNAYDDRNYHILEDPNMKNPLITKHCPHGYVLKISNSLDSQKLAFVEAQTEALIYLGRHSIKCPKPIRNVYGHYFSLERLSSGKNHVVRLLEYQQGQVLASVEPSDFLYYQTGEYVANMDRLLKDFTHSGYVDHKHIWMLENFAEIENFKHAVTEPDLPEIVDQVLKEFGETVMPLIHKLDRGVIHGDFNEHNILVELKDPTNEKEWRIAAVLDFGDSHISCYLFELAITMTYCLIMSGELRTGGLVLAGYSMARPISDRDIGLLRICILARLCQSLVMGAYSYKQDPNNEYLISNRKAALKILPLLWNETNESAAELWKGISDDYLTRSTR